NPSASETLHLLQIWILPERRGLTPGYEQRRFAEGERSGKLCLIASHDGRDGALRINQDAALYTARLAGGDHLEQSLARGRHAWLQLVQGELEVAGERLYAGDGLALSDERALGIDCLAPTELLLFDLA